MRQGWLAALAALVIAGPVAADGKIDPANRVPNKEPGYCVWVSVMMLDRQHGAGTTKGILDFVERYDLANPQVGTQTRYETRTVQTPAGPQVIREPVTVPYVHPPGGAGPDKAKTLLTKYGVPYRSREGPATDLTFLIAELDAGRAVAVAVGGLHCPLGCHEIVLTKIDRAAGVVTFVDCNDVENDYTWPLASFQNCWTGWALAVDPREEK